MKFDLNSVIFLFGAFQSLVFMIGINLKKPFYSDLKKITSGLLFTMMIVMIYYVAIFNGIINKIPFGHSFGTAAWMSITPIYYLLFKNIQDPKWVISYKHLILFTIPILFLVEILMVLIGLPHWIYSGVSDSQGALDLWMFLFLSSGILILGSTVYQYHKDKENNKSKAIIWFSYTLFGILVLYTLVYLFIRQKYIVQFETSLILLFLIFVFTLVFKTFRLMSFRYLFDNSKYDNQTLSESKIAIFTARLEQLMEDEKPYLNQKLKLPELAKLTGISSTDLSQLFNLYYHSNFYDFINRYRLNHLENLIINPDYQQYKIMALAEESGFNSKATFYKVFKEKHQLTPSQYIKKHK